MAYKVWYDKEMRNWIDQINQHTWLNVKYNEMQLESARETTAQLRDIADLEEEALSKHEESNELLRDMGVQFESFNSELQNQSESLSRVEAAVNNINTSIKEQTGEIHAMRSEIEALRLDQAYQSFAMWRQSHDGLIYQAWAENANKWLSTVQRYMKSIDSAYAQDLQSHVARVLNKHAGELTIENYYHPRAVLKPQKPVKVSEDEAFQDHLDGLRYAVIFAGIISSAAIWISTTLNSGLFGNFWRTTLNLSFVFFLPVAVFGLMMFGLRRFEFNWSDAHRREETASRNQDWERRYEEQMKKWEEKCKKLESAEQSRKESALKNLQADRDRLVKSAIADYKDLQIAWVKQDVVSISERIRTIIDTAMFRPPTASSLPDLPELEPVDTVVLPEDAYQLQYAIASIHALLNKDSINLKTYRLEH